MMKKFSLRHKILEVLHRQYEVASQDIYQEEEVKLILDSSIDATGIAKRIGYNLTETQDQIEFLKFNGMILSTVEDCVLYYISSLGSAHFTNETYLNQGKEKSRELTKFRTTLITTIIASAVAVFTLLINYFETRKVANEVKELNTKIDSLIPGLKVKYKSGIIDTSGRITLKTGSVDLLEKDPDKTPIYNNLFKDCQDYKILRKGTIIHDTVFDLTLHLPSGWSGIITGELLSLELKYINFTDTLWMNVYMAYDVENSHFDRELSANSKLKLVKFEGRKTLIIPPEKYRGRDIAEIHHEIQGWVITIRIKSTPSAITKQIICDAKSILWQLSEHLTKKK